MTVEFSDCDLSAWQEQGIVIAPSPRAEKKGKRAVRRAPWSTVVIGAVAFAGSLCAVLHPGPSGVAISKAAEPFIADLGPHRGDPDYVDAAYLRNARGYIHGLPVRNEAATVEDPAPII